MESKSKVATPKKQTKLCLNCGRVKEIKDYYKNWQIEMFESRKFNDEHENGIKHCHAMNKIVAKKLDVCL